MKKKFSHKIFLSLFSLIIAVSIAPGLSQTSDQIDPFYLDLLKDGKYFYENGDFAKAIDYLKIAYFGFLDSPPKLLECYTYLSVCYYLIKDIDQAKKIHDEIKKLKLQEHFTAIKLPQSLLDKYNEIDAYFSRLEARTAPPLPPSAKEKAAPKTAPPSPQQVERAQFFLNLARQEEDFKRKMVFYRQALRNDPTRLEIHFEMSQAYKAEKKYKAAAKILESLLKTHPENLQAYKELADIYITDKSFKKAISLLKRAETLEASDVEINFQLGYAYMQSKKYQEAAEEFRKVLEINPDHKQALELLEQCQEKIK